MHKNDDWYITKVRNILEPVSIEIILRIIMTDGIVVSQQDEFYQIANAIISELGPILSTRPYVAIVDFLGHFRYIDAELESYHEFIQNFAKSNFFLLHIGDHSLPLSINLAFFRVSKKALIVIFIKKGLIGQLLAFKARMLKYQDQIDALISEEIPDTPLVIPTVTNDLTIPEEPEVIESAEPKAQIIPVLLKQIDKKAKFPLNEVVILNYCDGKNSIEDIMREGNIDKTEVWRILDKYKKKDWIKITYLGSPTFIPVLSKEIPAMAVQLGVVNKTEFEISKYCDGSHSIEEIQQSLGIPIDELEEIIDKMEKNNIIHLEVR
ncbi:MAG: hypothetical protein EU536_00970 [Promethearchaeota archaeon]|nr:MAG: hypothetical protein EU536_00970 [Candidatus Lokiarchaeota archaeon]